MKKYLETAETLADSCRRIGLKPLFRTAFRGLGLSKCLAFTLAEVLITLGIIGVVASMTIPTLVSSYQKQSTITQLKKSYSILSEGFARSVVENGEAINWNWPSANYTTEYQECIQKYIVNYLRVLKNCHTPIDRTCFATKSWFANKNVSPYNSDLASKQYQVILTDGTSLNFHVESPKLEYHIAVDLNGVKKPNILGKDIFRIFYDAKKNRVIPNGIDLTMEEINEECLTGEGEYCAAKIMKDGWKMTDDYPW